VARSQGAVTRDDHPNDGLLSVFRKQRLSFLSKKCLRGMLVKFGAMREIVIESVLQPSTRECEMNLSLPVPGAVMLTKICKHIV
jgi:hypothetical protein